MLWFITQVPCSFHIPTERRCIHILHLVCYYVVNGQQASLFAVFNEPSWIADELQGDPYQYRWFWNVFVLDYTIAKAKKHIKHCLWDWRKYFLIYIFSTIIVLCLLKVVSLKLVTLYVVLMLMPHDESNFKVRVPMIDLFHVSRPKKV